MFATLEINDIEVFNNELFNWSFGESFGLGYMLLSNNVSIQYSKFKEWSFLTATPIEPDLMLEELKDIPFKIKT